jgi:hypothetical protein
MTTFTYRSSAKLFYGRHPCPSCKRLAAKFQESTATAGSHSYGNFGFWVVQSRVQIQKEVISDL